MTEDLPQRFDDFVRGTSTPGAFEAELMTLCRSTPDSAWNVLALLDQYHRRGKISAELYRAMRQKIERQALGIRETESVRESAPVPQPSVALPAAAACSRESTPRYHQHAALPADFAPCKRAARAQAPRGLRAARVATTSRAVPGKRVQSWQRHRASQAIALTALLLGVAASPAVREVPESAPTTAAAAPAPSPIPDPPARGPQLLSLSSDQYIVYPNQKMAEISVQRTLEDAGDASFIWWTKASGAKADEDYIAGQPKLAQMPDGVAAVKLYVPIIANPSRRHIEMFYVLIGKPGGADLGPIRRAAVFIMPSN
jgi:hypothetical protein